MSTDAWGSPTVRADVAGVVCDFKGTLVHPNFLMTLLFFAWGSMAINFPSNTA
jgi:hypothetical protein